jgi:UDP-2-acetamido-3-amino-2,3-dideoxy-glucuronate N-acetyltransferase
VKGVFIHPKALVETKSIGAGTRIWAFTHVMTGARIGKNCTIGDHCYVESGAIIDDNTVVKNGNMIWEGVHLAEAVFVGPHVFFTNDLYPRSRHLAEANNRYLHKRNWLQPTKIEQGASLGAGAVILAGITVGKYAMIAAGSVVTKCIDPHALVMGNPARARGWVCSCGQRLHLRSASMVCKDCQLKFQLTSKGLKVAACST